MFIPKREKRVIAGSTLGGLTLRVLLAVTDCFSNTTVKGYLYTREGARALRSRAKVATALLVLALAVSAVATVTQPAQTAAATANTVNFQARLMNASGSIVPDGTYNVEFKLYNASSSSGSSQGSCTGDVNCLWTEDYTSTSGPGSTDVRISVANGYLTANLGAITALPTNIWGQQLWLTMRIGGTAGSPSWDTEMSPRLLLTAVPAAYALVNTNGSFSSSLTMQGPTVGNQSFVIQDQGAGGTYNLCIQNSTACGFAPVSGTLSGSYINNSTTVQTAASLYIQPSSGNVGATIKANGSGDLFVLQNSSAQTLTKFNNNGDLSIGGTNASGSTTALQVLKGGSSTPVFTVDSTNNQAIVRGINSDATQGSELTDLSAGNNNFSVNWTTTNWTVGGGNTTATHNLGNTSALIYTGFTPTAGATYRVSFKITGTPAKGQGVLPQLGGVSGQRIYGTGTGSVTEQLITASTTGSLQFSPATEWGGTISVVSVKLVTLANSALTVQNSAGATVLEIRTSTQGSSTFLGQGSGQANVSGSNNTAVGTSALQSNTTGSNNVATGDYALYSNTNGQANAAFGSSALTSNTTGGNNNGFGSYTLENNTTGGNNVAVGTSALTLNTIGNYNTATGVYSLYGNSTGVNNTAAGYSSLMNLETLSGTITNTVSHTFGSTTGACSAGTGYAKFTTSFTGGMVAGMGITIAGTTSYNGAATVCSVDSSTAFTVATVFSTADTVGSWYSADPSNNAAFGYSAGNGSSNGYVVQGGAYFGANAGLNLQSGADYNTLVGFNAGTAVTTGTQNVLLGYNAGANLTTGGSNIIIGAGVNASSATVSNQLAIGNLIQGDMSGLTLSLLGDTTLATNKSLTFGTGAGGGNFDMHLSTGTFQTGSGTVSINGDTTLASGKTLTVQGTSSFNVSSTLAFEVKTGSSSYLTVDTSGGNIILGKAGTSTGILKFANATGANTVGLQAGASTAAYTLTLPTAGPSTSQCLQSDATTATLLVFGSCAGGGGGDNIQVNGSAATDANFLDVSATGTVAGTTWTLNTGATPNTLSVNISNASASQAGAVTTGAQTFAGAKTFQANSSTAFQVQNTSSVNLLSADTNNLILNTLDINVGAGANVGGATRLFSDSFESGTSTIWTGGTGGSGAKSIQSATVRNGVYAGKIVTSANGGYFQTTIASNATVYARTYFNVTTLGNPTVLEDFGTNIVGFGGHLYIYLGASGNLCYSSILNGSVSACSATAPSTSTWHTLETKLTIGTATGVLQVWLDGTLVTSNANAINLSSQNFGNTNISNFALGNNTSSTATVYFDDVAVDTVATGNSSSLNVTDSLHVAGSGSVGGSLVVGSANSDATITLVGGSTTLRPASPTAGMLYYDSTTNTLETYNGTKWTAAPRTATKVVAASNSSQAAKDAADYVATNSDDGATINTALSALPAGGGTVYLEEGTYTLGTTSITIPNNSILAGSGSSTILTYPNSFGSGFTVYKAIKNTDTATGTRVTVRDMLIDGNGANQTGGFFNGIYFSGMGGGTGSTAREGGKIQNVYTKKIFICTGCNSNGSILLTNSSNNIISGNTTEVNSGTGSPQYGIYLTSSSNSNTIIGNLGQGVGIGIGVEDSSYNTITGNTEQGTSTGIYLAHSSSSSNYNIVSGNNIYGTTGDGIAVYGSNNNNITSNKIHDSGGTSNSGIHLLNASFPATNNSIVGNDITDTSCATDCSAINIASSNSTGNYISANHMLGDGTHPAIITDAGANGNTYANQPLSEKGDASFRNATNSATAFQIQNAAGNAVLSADTSGANVIIGKAAALTGTLQFANATGSNVVGLQAGASTAAYTLTLPTAGPNLNDCLKAGAATATLLVFGSCGSGIASVGAIDGSGSSNANGATVTSGVLYLNSASASFGGVVNTGTQTFAGAKVFQNNSTTAFQIQNTSATSLLTADTNNLVINVGAVQPSSFAAKADYTVGTAPNGIAVADFNSDGKPDIAVANQSTNNISVLLNNGNGTFATKVDYTATTGAYGIAVADFNGDGKPDIVTDAGATASVLLNNGNGTFSTKADYTVNGGDGIAVADVNGDGKPDIVTAGTSAVKVSVLINNGNGTFAAKVDYTAGTSPNGPKGIAVADVNGDGKPDIVTANTSSLTDSVLLNNGNGTFAAKVDYAVNLYGQRITIGDLNGDGKADIVNSNGSGGISVLMNNGNGTFATKVDYATGNYGDDTAIADVNGDGKLDIVTSNQSDQNIAILLNNGSGTFATPVTYATANQPYFIATADFNGDGKPDIATSNHFPNSVSVLLNTNTATVKATGNTSIAGIANIIGSVFADGQIGLQLQDTLSPSSGGTQTGSGLAVTNAPVGISNIGIGQSITLADSTALSNTLQGMKIAVNDTGTGAKTIQGLVVDTTGTTNLTATTTTALFKSDDSKTAFLVQGSQSNNIFDINTTTVKNLLNEGNFEGSALAAVGGWAKLNGFESTFQTSSSAAQFGSQSLQVTTDGSTANGGAKYIFPFRANTTYTFSIYAAVSSGSISTFDLGTSINGTVTTCISGKTLTTTMTRFSCSFTTGGTVVNGSDYIFARRSTAAVVTMYFDGAQLEYGSSASNYVDPPVYNIISNPSFESGTNGWATRGSGTTIATNETYANTGNRSLAVTTTTTTNAGASFSVALLPNSAYTLSGYARVAAGASSITDFADGRQENGVDATCTAGQTVTTSWTRFSCTFATGSPVNTPTNIWFGKTGSSAETFYLDSVQLERNANASQYVEAFDNLHVDALTNTITLNGNNSGEIQPWQLNANALPLVRSQAMSVIANGYIYEIGGYDGSGSQTTVYYAKLNADGSTGAWQTNANPLPSGRQGANTVVANGFVYVIGGTGSNTVYYAKLNADGSTGAWQMAANSLPANRQYALSGLANGYVYIIGGNNSGVQSTVYYAKLNADGTVGAWQTSPNTLARMNASSVVANGYIYIIGGDVGPVATISYAKLNADGSVGTWQSTTSLPQALDNSSAVIVNGYVYIIGGYNGSSTQSTVFYAKLNADGTVGAWQTSANALPDLRSAAAAVTANGYIYEIGGAIINSIKSTVYYTSTSRVQVGGSLDLVGLGGQLLGDVGGTGGSITAANGTFVGDLQVQGQTNLNQGAVINGSLTTNGTVNIRSTQDSKTGFQIQSNPGGSILDVNTTSFLNLLNEGNFEGGSAATGGWGKLIGSETLSTSSSAAQFGSQSLSIGTISNNQGAAYTFPFKASTTYTFSVYAKASTSFTGIDIGTNINSATTTCVSGQTLTTSFTRFICTFTVGNTVSNGNDYLFIRSTSLSAQTIYIDGAQLEYGSSASSYVDPPLYNLIGNPSFEQGTNGWSAKASGTTIATDQTYVNSGRQALKVATTTTANAGASFNVPLLANTMYTLSGYARLDTGSSSDFVVGRQEIGSDITCLTAQALSTTYTRFTCTFTTGANVNSTTNIFFQKSGASAENIYLDSVQLERNASASQYVEAFDNLHVDALTNTITLNGNNSGEIQPWQLNANVVPAALQSSTSVTANGYVYEIGGFSGSGQQAVYYAKLNADGSTGAWQTSANSLPDVRRDATSVTANGYVYEIGGIDGSGNTKNTIYYAKLNADGSTGAWQTNANTLPAVRQYATSVVSNGFIYEIAGTNGGGPGAQSTVYYAKLNADGSTGVWQTNAYDLGCATAGCGSPVVRYYATSVVANGYVYEIGGYNGSSVEQSSVYYAKLNADGSTGAWQTSANALPAIRRNATSVVANGYVYEIGGVNNNVAQSTIYYAKLNADGSTGAWQTSANPLPGVRGLATSVLVNGYIYELDGTDMSNKFATVYYTSTSRVLVGGSLDLVGLGGQTLNEQGGTGGTLTAGNTTIVGSLDVRDQANFTNNLGVNGTVTVNGNETIKAVQNSTNFFQVQNGSGVNVLNLNTVNLIANSDFETGTGATSQIPDGWSKKGSATISVDNTQFKFGSESMKVVTTTAANDGAFYSYQLLPSTQYTLSMYVYQNSGGSYTDIDLGHQEAGADIVTGCSGNTVTNATWTRLTCTFTTGATINTSNLFIRKTNAATAETFYVDGVQLETAAAASTYREADVTLNGNLIIKNLTNSNTITLQSGATSSSYSLTLPTALPGTTQCLQSDNTGVMGWSSCGSPLTETAQADGFTIAGGTTSRTLTVTGADITIGNIIQPTSAGAISLRANGANSVGIADGTAGSAVTIGNTTSNPNIAFNGSGTFGTTTGAVSLNGDTTVATGKTLTVNTIQSAAATALSITGTTTLTLASTGANNVSIDSGTTGGISIGTSANSKNIGIGNTTGSTTVEIESGSTGLLGIGDNAAAQTLQIGNNTGATMTTIAAGSGGIFLKPNTNNTTALFIQDTLGTTYLNIDTTTTGPKIKLGGGLLTIDMTSSAPNIQIGSATTDATAVLLVADSYNQATDPTGINGAMYYSTNSNTFRCYENGAWKDCDPIKVVTGSSAAGGSKETWQSLTSNATTTTSTTLADVMATTGLAAGTYEFEYTVIWQSAATTTGANFCINYTGTVTKIIATRWEGTTGTTAASGVTDSTAATNGGQLVEQDTSTANCGNLGPNAGVDTANANEITRIKGILVAGGTGTLSLRAATEVAASGVTVQSGTSVILHKLN